MVLEMKTETYNAKTLGENFVQNCFKILDNIYKQNYWTNFVSK